MEGAPSNTEDKPGKLEKPKRHKGSEALGLYAVERSGNNQSPEHLGKVIVEGESGYERSKKGASKDDMPRNFDTISRAELLEISQSIIVEGSSLRHIYESHLVGERGLRRLVEIHANGGDVQKALRNEVLEREIDFERDPAMRDKLSTGGTIENSETLDSLLKRASKALPADSEEAAFLKAKSAYQTHSVAKYKQRRRLLDLSIISLICILIAIILVLVLAR